MFSVFKPFLLLFLFVTFTVNFSFAQDSAETSNKKIESEKEVSESVEKKSKENKDNSKDGIKKKLKKFMPQKGNQQPWGFYGTYSIYDTWIPGKKGLIASYGDADRTWELSWQNASYNLNILGLDLGKISDTRIHLTTRSFSSGRSFNFQYGIYYNTFEAGLGNDFTDAVGQSKDIFQVETAGVMWGMGNRWTWENGISLGMDWFKIFWPITVVNEEIPALDEDSLDEDDKDDLEAAKNTVTKLPTFSLLHFEIGYRF